MGSRHGGPRLLVLNGLPAIVADRPPRRAREAPRSVLTCEVDAAGRIRTLYVVVASRKLTALPRNPD
jgi:RNA polymerase sigma-70 factor (ECF subfamily)